MCTEPKTFDGIEVSCRECDQCCATYKNTWVARCLAEMKTHRHALAFTLTYADNEDGTRPLGAKVFRYKDVQDMWKRLRYHGVSRFGKSFMVRYVVVGEMGTRKGRCHYHGVMFSNYPIKELGIFTNSRGDEYFGYKMRLNWSIWGNGFVEFQRADRKGISYALKYILKARMTVQRSEGQGREGKTEWLAASYLWCSKVPAIGSIWLNEKLSQMFEKGMCFPSLRVPTGTGGDWYISGEVQKQVCLRIKAENDYRQKEHGQDLSGFRPLLASVSDPIINTETGEILPRKAKEWLENGETQDDWTCSPEEQQREREAFNDFLRAREAASRYSNRARKCFGIKACSVCQGLASPERRCRDEQAEFFWREIYQREIERYRLDGGLPEFGEWITQQGLVALSCGEQYETRQELERQSYHHRDACDALRKMQGAPLGGRK